MVVTGGWKSVWQAIGARYKSVGGKHKLAQHGTSCQWFGRGTGAQEIAETRQGLTGVIPILSRWMRYDLFGYAPVEEGPFDVSGRRAQMLQLFGPRGSLKRCESGF